MNPYDSEAAARVWQRVYAQKRPKAQLTQRQREALRRCMQQTSANLTVYEHLCSHPVYGDAFTRLRDETQEQIKMLRQILNQR